MKEENGEEQEGVGGQKKANLIYEEFEVCLYLKPLRIEVSAALGFSKCWGRICNQIS